MEDWIEMTSTAKGYWLPVIANGHGKVGTCVFEVDKNGNVVAEGR
jgi:hypothetical protein